MAQIRIQPALGLRVDLKPERGLARWYGTRQQLEDEGIIAPDDEWPQTPHDRIRRAAGNCFFVIQIAPGQEAAPEPHRIYQVNHYAGAGGEDRRQHRAMLKVKEAAHILAIGTHKWCEDLRRHDAARADQPFQNLKRALLGQKKRGRKPTNGTHARSTDGAGA